MSCQYFQVTFNGKQYWTNTTFLQEENQNAIQQIQANKKPVQNGLSLATFLGSVVLSNKVSAVAKLPVQYRAAAVLGSTVVARLLGGFLYSASTRSDIEAQLVGSPLWEKKFDVPELDKMYFFLDDDKNYAPNLWHHGIEAPKKYEAIFQL